MKNTDSTCTSFSGTARQRFHYIWVPQCPSSNLVFEEPQVPEPFPHDDLPLPSGQVRRLQEPGAGELPHLDRASPESGGPEDPHPDVKRDYEGDGLEAYYIAWKWRLTWPRCDRARKFDEIRLPELDQRNRDSFWKAMKKEIKNNIAADAYKILTPEESAQVRQREPNKIMESRFVLTAKPLGAPGGEWCRTGGITFGLEPEDPCKAKARCDERCCRGWILRDWGDYTPGDTLGSPYGNPAGCQSYAATWISGLDPGVYVRRSHSAGHLCRSASRRNPRYASWTAIEIIGEGMLWPLAWFQHLNKMLVNELPTIFGGSMHLLQARRAHQFSRRSRETTLWSHSCGYGWSTARRRWRASMLHARDPEALQAWEVPVWTSRQVHWQAIHYVGRRKYPDQPGPVHQGEALRSRLTSLASGQTHREGVEPPSRQLRHFVMAGKGISTRHI